MFKKKKKKKERGISASLSKVLNYMVIWKYIFRCFEEPELETFLIA